MARSSKESAKEKYEKQKALARERQRRRRANLTPEQLEKKRQYDRDRHSKLKTENKIRTVKDMNEREKRKMRKYWKEQNKKRKEKKAMVHAALGNTPPASSNVLQEENEPGPSSSQKKRGRKAVRKDRAKAYRTIESQKKKIEKLERKLNKYKQRLSRQTKKTKTAASPSPAKQVKSLVGCTNVSPAIKKQLFLGFALKKQLESKAKQASGKKKAHQLLTKAVGNEIIKKYRVQKHFKKIIPYRANPVLAESSEATKYSRKARSGIRNELSGQLKAFFEDDSVSRMCPGKKDSMKKGKLRKQRRVLLDTLANLHKKFVSETKHKISLTSFLRAKPFWVDFPKTSDRETCACVRHANFELLLSSLKTMKVIKEKTTNEVLNSVVCSIKNESCMRGRCNNCKDKEIVFNFENDFMMKYCKWVNVKEERTIKEKKKIVQKTVKVTAIKNVSKVCSLFKKELVDFKTHVHSTIHQASQLKQKIENLKDDEILFRIDFSENYVAKYAEEVQSVHFGASKRQLSLHTGVLYAHKEKVSSFCTVSDQLDHQSHAIWAHMEPILKRTADKHPKTTAVHVFSDSPTNQYRNRMNMHLFRSMVMKYFPNVTSMSWNFTEAGHGKGPMDGIGGSLKREADKKVAFGSDITNAAEFITALSPSTIYLEEIQPEKVDQMKKEVAELDIPPIVGITKVRQITFSKVGRTYANKLSCFNCPTTEKCLHHHSFEVPIIKGTSKTRLRYYDVYTSSEDEEPNIPLADCLPAACTEDKMEVGAYLLIKVPSSNQPTFKNFVAVCQSKAINSEFEVMFMKSCNKDSKMFLPDESDVSVVHFNQVVKLLQQPKLIAKGNRFFYKFNSDPLA